MFDNVDTPEVLNRYWPACGHGSILVTTQDRKLVHRACSEVLLKTLPDEDGSRLLLEYLPNSVATANISAELAKQISSEVKGLPLLLVGLAGHMADSHTTLSETLQDLKQPWDEEHHVLSELGSDSATYQYDKPTQKAFDMSLNRVSPAAMSVLRVFSMLAADAIPEPLLFQKLGDESLQFGGYTDKSRSVTQRPASTRLVTTNILFQVLS